IAPVKKPSGTKIYYRPLGVVGVISPWNYPLAMANNLLLPALVAGNTVVLKPSEITPLVADMFVRTLNEVLPNGVLSVIHGDGEVGKALVASNINMVAFTGSAAAGKHIMASSANKLHRLVMELGGNDPMIVLADADINKAARFAVASSFENAGQMCTSTERIYVDERIHNTFVERVVEIAKQYSVGPWDQPRVNIGPIVNKKQHQQIIHHLKDAKEKGARFLLGSDDYLPPYIQPTVIDGLTDEMLMAKEETFGPVVAIDSFSNIDEAIMRANNVPLGLGAVVFGESNAAYVAENMEAGMVGINGGPGAGDGPWVGAKESGFGYHGSLEGHRQFTQVQVISA
ncbi:MAG: aldehyde dehydrogenase family protein, partial [Pseudomonadota bacterium]|nr:aldehyde dehydrogenase family protein [Pseudomonadota bacterium]